MLEEQKDIPASRFRDRIRNRVLHILRMGPSPWLRILRQCNNCDPAILYTVLDELHEEGILASKKHKEKPEIWSLSDNLFSMGKFTRGSDIALAACHSKSICKNSSSSLMKELLQELEDHLPEPSPVFAQWWFSRRSYKRLVEFIASNSGSDRPIAFLGCTTLGSIYSRLYAVPTTILDVDNYLLQVVANICSRSTDLISYDVLDETKSRLKGTFGFVFVDPPWSRNLIPKFLISAASLVSMDGKIAISIPQSLTRATMPEEIAHLLSLAQKLGLKLEQVKKRATQYEVPPFEKIAYESIGLSLKAPWRTGDLFIFKRITTAFYNAEISAPETRKCWDQFRFGKSRLFLKRDGNNENGPPLIRPIPDLSGGVLPTTSSRSRHWASASLVTSHNRMASAAGRNALSQLLAKLLGNSSTKPLINTFEIGDNHTQKVLNSINWLLGENRE
jgi:predicted methyltransferase